jgi:spectinomycin phosphotransferase
MLEKPDLPDQLIISRLQDEYGLHVTRVNFLPIGADVNTVVFRIDANDGTAYFLKLRKGPFAEITVSLPALLKSQGIHTIIAPLPTRSQQLWTSLEHYKMVLYPFIEGQNAYEAAPSERQWLEFGATLKALHAVRLPTALSVQIPHETYSPAWQEQVKFFQAQVEVTRYPDPAAKKVAALMKAKRAEIDRLVARAGQLGQELSERNPEQVLCHSDMHAGNLHLAAQDALYIVDWDAPIFAPKELDLAMVGGSSIWNSAREEGLFYRGYGQVEIDTRALAYYRCERAILDIAEYGKQLLQSDEGNEDREQSYQYFASSFLAGHEIELALRTEIV